MNAGDPPRDVEDTLALAHALRTPLTSLSMAVGLLDDGALGPLNDAQRELVRVMVSEVGRLALLVDQALRTDRLGPYAGPIERVKVDLAGLIGDAIQPIVAQALDKGVLLTLRLRAGIVAVADPVKLAWVVTSLTGNALRYSPPGASIAVDLDASLDEAELRIDDRGPGMSAEIAARIFERGGGPGLFLAREIVEAHGGRIHLRSAPGEGSTITITLPATLKRAHDLDEEESGP